MTGALSRRTFFRGGSRARSVRRPPWTDDSFTDQCTRCGECLKACPEQVLFSGDGGFPEIRFEQEGCTFCGQCGEACEAPVFDLSRVPFPWHADIKQSCLALNDIHCQSCQDACDVQAIKFRPSLGKAPAPELDADSCNGCGACLTVCPQDAINLVTENADV